MNSYKSFKRISFRLKYFFDSFVQEGGGRAPPPRFLVGLERKRNLLNFSVVTMVAEGGGGGLGTAIL